MCEDYAVKDCIAEFAQEALGVGCCFFHIIGGSVNLSDGRGSGSSQMFIDLQIKGLQRCPS